MSVALKIAVIQDTATPALKRLHRFATASPVVKRMADACVKLTQRHLKENGTNKNNWPTTGFWREVAANTTSEIKSNGSFDIVIDHPTKPGAAAYQYHGGTIHAKDKLLTIPARAEFYGKRAIDFIGLRFGMFKGGTKFLYIEKGGAEHVQRIGRKTKSTNRGTSKRAAMMIAYWLKDSVSKEADHEVIPSDEDYHSVIEASLWDSYEKFVKQGGSLS